MRKILIGLIAVGALAVGAGAGTLYRMHRAAQAALSAAHGALAELVVYQAEPAPAAAVPGPVKTAAKRRPTASRAQLVRLAPARVDCALSGACEVLGAVTFRARLANGAEVERTAEVAVGIAANGRVERVDFYDTTSRG